jgi:hypothetical protein
MGFEVLILRPAFGSSLTRFYPLDPSRCRHLYRSNLASALLTSSYVERLIRYPWGAVALERLAPDAPTNSSTPACP